DGTSDHVGIVEKTEGSTVYTVEGNSSDAVNKRSYDINNGTIMGYGIL
ncbi:CHAP domain-containing protein, partial [Blautia sp. CLA-JM-H16]